MALRGTNQEFGRPYNRRLVLELIRRHGPITRSEIAKLTGLTVQTVSTIARELDDQGFAISARREPKGRGLPPASLTLNPEGGHAVGVHVTPMGIEAALVMLGTLLAGKPVEPESIVWAESLGTPAEGYRVTVWDRLGLWFAVAVVLVLIAYVVPIWDILHLTRYGSPGFKPF